MNSALVEAQLRGLVRRGWNVELDAIDPKIGAATSADPNAPDERLAFFLAGETGRDVGRALQWASSRQVDRLMILAPTGGADLARRASLLSVGDGPRPEVWSVDGTEVSPAEAIATPKPPPLPDSHWSLAGIMSEAGARPIDDHGRLVAEVTGLEVARVVEPEAVAGVDTEPEIGPTIEVGVGQADRELNQLVHRETDPGANLRRVIAAVAEHRTAGGHHPLTRLARERWLRSVLLDQPHMVHATELHPLVPLRPRHTLLAAAPAAAAGTLLDGGPVVVVAMAGVDLDLMPEAADYRARHNPDAELVVVVPPRDERLSAMLVHRVPGARLVTVDPPWG